MRFKFDRYANPPAPSLPTHSRDRTFCLLETQCAYSLPPAAQTPTSPSEQWPERPACLCRMMLLNIGRDLFVLSAVDRPLVLILLLAVVHALLQPFWKLTRRHPASQTGHEQALKMAADPVSSIFPNRPIRPLPKRRLRERLSPEVADSIQYPPPPRTVAPLFPYPYPLTDENPPSSFPPVRRGGSYPEQQQSRSNGLAVGNDDGNSALRQGVVSRAALGQPGLVARPKPEHGRYANSFPPPSATSSADGYDPFENTNNKKRKIPTAGDSAPSGVHAVNDTAVGTGPLPATVQSVEGHSETLVPTSTPYYGSGSFASGVHNIPGPGRGRYGRPRSFKSQIRPLFDATNSWAGRSKPPRSYQWTAGSSKSTGPPDSLFWIVSNCRKLAPCSLAIVLFFSFAQNTSWRSCC